jgi:hypothetical protein
MNKVEELMALLQKDRSEVFDEAIDNLYANFKKTDACDRGVRKSTT